MTLAERVAAHLALEAASPRFDLSAAATSDDGEAECPLCGEGVVDVSTYTNLGNAPIGIEVFGIGSKMTAATALVRETHTACALLREQAAEIERLQIEVERLEDQIMHDAWFGQP